MSNIVITGGNGFLATELKKILKATYLTRKDMDITNEMEVASFFYDLNPDLVVHLAGLTDVNMGDCSKEAFYRVNVLGTRNVAKYSPKLMYWSTEYVFDGIRGYYNELDHPNPLNFYGLSKLLGEYEARNCPNSVVLRTAMKPRPYKHPVVPEGMYSSGGYVDDMAKEYKLAIEHFDELPPTIHVGLQRKLLYDLARETREVGYCDPKTLPVRLPLDSSLDCGLWNRFKKRL